ncbi:hypothetical protein Bbelb_125760 [Branchiostoma belcheri]|nr:hypothetical protein Bbelb_125760 [Branchiostoma belcheri]
MRDANMDACLEQLHAQTASAVALLQQYTEWEEGDRVLDVGCGCGEVTKYISQQPTVSSVLGIDLSPQLINYAETENASPKTIRAVENDSRWRHLVKSRKFTYTIYPWLENDVAGFRRFIEECGFVVEVCRSRRHKVHIPCEETFRDSVRPFMPHFDYIPEEFHEDLWKTAWHAVEACAVGHYKRLGVGTPTKLDTASRSFERRALSASRAEKTLDTHA